MAVPTEVHIVTGKGGVGKTAVAAALGLAQAKRGHRVLVAEANGGDQVARALGAEPVGYQLREVLENLHVVDIQPTEAMREYALFTLRFEALYKAVFENPLTKRFIRLIPSLAELVMLGKVWYHAQPYSEGPDFDTIVLDAPSTGHAISLLHAPAVVEQTIPAGPLMENARQMRELLTDPARTRLHIVTTPEEMPVSECLELVEAAKSKLQIALGTIYVNMCISPLAPSGMELLSEAAQSAPALEPLLRAMKLRETKRTVGEENLERLPNSVPSVRLPRRPCDSDSEVTQHLAECIAHAEDTP